MIAYVDHGLTATNRDRPGLRLALAGCRSGDTLVVTKLDRLARSLPTPVTSWTS
jgi:DNA invertase Pin-like site-specific DNA recombinase